ncbi:type II secretion system minor pseudopilin GspK [Vibrio rumoiensis]|uniref:Type II secretion system protein K n=1 Tax=Vibrio rumoiensis 1S-45 TaxID=1188252 RepID=A0A1E5E603_9VIBR|nr:type II secretion system minor pseudopilin GspK [Vibrio rumoiensis]OEF29446.1 general secretion pathway protein GspK [Vibrio rumoiensis 1S-45]
MTPTKVNKQYCLQRRPSRQKGVALIFVLMLVGVLVGIAATMTERMSTQFYRASNLLHHQQAYWYGVGVEALAQVAIEETYKENDDNINLSQAWALQGTNYPLDNGEAVGSIYDKQACFNVNALTGLPNTNNNGQRPYLLKVLAYMLQEEGIDNYQAEVIADSIKEYVDSDEQVTTQSGVESATYEGFKPPYDAPNTMIADASELRAVNQVTGPAMKVLNNVACAIPSADLLINVNTLEPRQALLLAGLFQPALSLNDAEKLLENRPRDGWKDVDTFLNESEISGISPDIKAQASPFLAVTSQYFELDAQVKVEDSRVRLRSLIYSSDNKTTEIIRRRFGGISERVSDNKAEQ